MRYLKIVIILLSITFFIGCSTKKEAQYYNKPAVFWYKKILTKIQEDDLEKADDYYTSLSSEHVTSPLLKACMLILSKAHSDNEEYILANFYLDEFIKRFGNRRSIEYAKYLKIKTNFNAFAYPKRDQMLLENTIKNAHSFLKEYPDSKYAPLVQTMLTKLSLSQKIMNGQIVSLYKRIDKPKAAKIYEKRIKNSWYKDIDYIGPDTAWYREIFE